MYRFIKTSLLICGILFFISCSEKGIIPKDKMAYILSQMYLTDQFINDHPNYNAQKDTTLVYPAIINKMGYTKEDYAKSITYYLAKKDEYKIINLKARAILAKREAILKSVMSLKNKMKWWLPDTLKNLSKLQIASNPQLRSFRWMVFPIFDSKWKATDSLFTDTPASAEWWKNNIISPKGDFKFSESRGWNKMPIPEKDEKETELKIESDKKPIINSFSSSINAK